jgi:hypothetical protein
LPGFATLNKMTSWEEKLISKQRIEEISPLGSEMKI